MPRTWEGQSRVTALWPHFSFGIYFPLLTSFPNYKIYKNRHTTKSFCFLQDTTKSCMPRIIQGAEQPGVGGVHRLSNTLTSRLSCSLVHPDQQWGPLLPSLFNKGPPPTGPCHPRKSVPYSHLSQIQREKSSLPMKAEL